MSRYTVVWDATVEWQFTEAWITADSATRAALTRVANWIDENLAQDASSQGSPRHDLNARAVEVPTDVEGAEAYVIFRVIEDDRQVRVTRLIFRRRTG